MFYVCSWRVVHVAIPDGEEDVEHPLAIRLKVGAVGFVDVALHMLAREFAEWAVKGGLVMGKVTSRSLNGFQFYAGSVRAPLKIPKRRQEPVANGWGPA